MPQTLTDALAREVFSRLPPDRPHGPADFESVPLLLARALRQRLADEVDARLTAVAPWVGDGSDRWVSAARAQARFPAEAWREAVPAEAERIVSTLIAPSREMTKWAIPEGEAPVDDVLDRMRQFGAYPYLTEIVGRYAEKKGLGVFEADAFEQLLVRIDRRLAAELDVDGWMALLAPLYDLAEAVPELARALSGLVLGEVFAARGMPGVGSRLVERKGVGRAGLRIALREILNADADDAVLEAALRSGALDHDHTPEASGENESAGEEEITERDPVAEAEPAEEEQADEMDSAEEAAVTEADKPENEAEPDETLAAEGETSAEGLSPEAEEESVSAETEPTGPPEARGEDDGPLAEEESQEPDEADDGAPQPEAETLDTLHIGRTEAEAPESSDASGEEGRQEGVGAGEPSAGLASVEETGVPPNPFGGIDAGPTPVDMQRTQALPGVPGAAFSEPAAAEPEAAFEADGRATEVDAPEAEMPERDGQEPDMSEPAVPEPVDPAPEAAPEPLWARLARERREAAGEPETPEAEEGGTPLWKQFASGGAAPDAPMTTLADSIFEKEAPPPTLRDTIADAPPDEVRPEDHEVIVLGEAAENGAWYVESLFAGNAEAYAGVLALLVEAASWTDATQIIGREVFRRYKVNIYSEPAVSFTGAVEARYQRR